MSIDSELPSVIEVKPLFSCDPKETSVILNDRVCGSSAESIVRGELSEMNMIIGRERPSSPRKN